MCTNRPLELPGSHPSAPRAGNIWFQNPWVKDLPMAIDSSSIQTRLFGIEGHDLLEQFILKLFDG